MKKTKMVKVLIREDSEEMKVAKVQLPGTPCYGVWHFLDDS